MTVWIYGRENGSYAWGNRGKYDTAEIVKLWEQLTPAEQESTGGIMKGAFNFIKEMEA